MKYGGLNLKQDTARGYSDLEESEHYSREEQLRDVREEDAQ